MKWMQEQIRAVGYEPESQLVETGVTPLTSMLCRSLQVEYPRQFVLTARNSYAMNCILFGVASYKSVKSNQCFLKPLDEDTTHSFSTVEWITVINTRERSLRHQV